MLEEMKASDATKQNLRILNLTNFDDDTIKGAKGISNTNALAFIFRSFKGNWVQNIAAFYSTDCASNKVLSHLIIECVILLENNGIYIDVVTSDDDAWIKKLLELFGVEKCHVSCDHPCSMIETDKMSYGRRLWFCSNIFDEVE